MPKTRAAPRPLAGCAEVRASLPHDASGDRRSAPRAGEPRAVKHLQPFLVLPVPSVAAAEVGPAFPQRSAPQADGLAQDRAYGLVKAPGFIRPE